MKIKYIKLLSLISIVFISSFILSACGKKTASNTKTTPTPEVTELKLDQKPYISLIPREDGHELKLKIDNIPSTVSQIEYELIYTAEDNGLEIEKGVGDTIKVDKKSLERDLLLGTSSCTNGCKYKYDTGITGGTLTLTFLTENGQVANFETPFVLKTSADIKKDNGFKLATENLTINATTTTKSDYFVLIKNFPIAYSLFSNGTGTGKVSSITPDTITKTNLNSLVGDYILK